MASPVDPPGREKQDFCPKCNLHFHYDDDSHQECMRCRGFEHECNLCPEMGKKAKERVMDWLKKHKAPIPQCFRPKEAKVPDQQPAPQVNEQTVSFADLRVFGQNLSREMKEFMASLMSQSQPASQGVTSGVKSKESGSAVGFRAPDPPAAELSVHPDSMSEGELCEGDDDDDAMSVRSSWDYKRTGSLEEDGETESVVSADREEGESLSASETERYVDVIAGIIEALDIGEAVRTPKSKSKIVSSRCKDKGPQALLPFDENHRAIVDGIWKGDANNISMYRKSTKDRYRLTDNDFSKYLKVSKVQDEYLVHELERSGLKVQVSNPKLPQKEMANIDTKVSHIETQSLLGMSCAVTQSWMLQYLTSQITKLDKELSQGLQPEDYRAMSDRVNLKQLAEVSVLAQDAAMDTLDLQARQAAEAKWIRRSMWIDQTRWSPSLKTAVKRFPTSGDGSLCGPNLKDKLESYRLTSKALEASSYSGQQKRGAPKRGRPQHSSAPPPKRMRFDRPTTDWRQNQRGRGRGRGSGGRGQQRSATSSFPKPGSSSMSG